MSLFWDKRYSSEEYAYGTEPNQFLKSQLQLLHPGKILLPGEGEGRNAVYAAKQGWSAYAFDSSSEAAKKAAKLAGLKNVAIQYKLADITEMNYNENEFDCIALIFLHLAPAERIPFHKKMLHLLKQGGVLLLEAFSKQQLGKNTGGPQNSSMLYSKEELHADFASASQFNVNQVEIILNEGRYHQGTASIIRVTATK